MHTSSEQNKTISTSASNSFLHKKEWNDHNIQLPSLCLRPKLTIGASDDIFEKEADAMADKVMRMPMPVNFLTSENIVDRKCDKCEAGEKLHRKENSSESTIPPPIVHDVLNSTGKSLDGNTRSFMEPRFNYNFSNVKIHDNDVAAKSAGSINALAYTSGKNVVFNEGQFDTNSDPGKRLLAHELTHVVQQTGDLNRRIGETVVQKFGATEHKNAGDEASKEFSPYNERLGFELPGGKLPFVLTFGDFTMLSGDLFDPRDTITINGKQQPNPDSLFLIAARPSSNPGLERGTQDEIIFAIYDNDHNDPRFLKGGIWESLPAVFEAKDPKTKEYVSKDVRKAVNERYLLMASKNYEHFVQPSGADLGPLAGLGNSAGGSYRALHEDAILRAYYAGQKGETESEGLMREAAAQHFLQDYFSSGHLRTPRKAIDDHWMKKYPLFFENMKKKIALDMARYINDHTNKPATWFGSVLRIYGDIYADLQKQTAGLPPIGFGAILGEVMHHNDNEVGVWVKNQLGHRWLDYGDGNLNKSFQLSDVSTHKYADNRTPDMIMMAVKLGIEDIRRSYEMSRHDATAKSSAAILSQVKKGGTDRFNKGGDLYAPEMALPQLDTTADNGDISAWQASSVDELWLLRVRTDRPDTFGQLITESLHSGQIFKQLDALAKQIPRTHDAYFHGIYLGELYPQAAFRLGFIKSLQDNALKGLKSIIDFNPSEGQFFSKEDDAIVDEMAKMNQKQRSQFTLKQRADRIKAMVDCTFCYVSHEEGELVISLFSTANSGDRSRLYQMVEGHAWKGDWKHGWFENDDEIWNGLERGQLDRLRKIINTP